MLAKLCRLASAILKFVWTLITAIFRARETKSLDESKQRGISWDQDWEEFSVSVVPNEIKETVQNSVVDAGCDRDDHDDVLSKVLNEMQPVIKKTQKVIRNNTVIDIKIWRCVMIYSPTVTNKRTSHT